MDHIQLKITNDITSVVHGKDGYFKQEREIVGSLLARGKPRMLTSLVDDLFTILETTLDAVENCLLKNRLFDLVTMLAEGIIGFTFELAERAISESKEESMKVFVVILVRLNETDAIREECNSFQ
jgi:hypothetical protein